MGITLKHVSDHQYGYKQSSDIQLGSLIEEAIIPDSFFSFPADQISFLYRPSKNHFSKICAMIKLRSNPDFLAAVSHYTIRDDMAVFRLLRCTGETSLDGVRSVVYNKRACWQYLLRWLVVAWHLLDALDRLNVLGISSNGAPSNTS